MSILTNPLPEHAVIGGAAFRINSGFRTGVEFELLMQNEKIPPEEKVRRALALYYPELPPDRGAALRALLDFYSCAARGAEAKDEKAPEQRPRQVAAYCFEEDAPLIFAAFMECYGINLNRVKDLHWWEFRALLTGLPQNCRFAEVMGFRTADSASMPKRQRAHFERMKKLYALKNRGEAAPLLSLAERDRRMKEHVARCFGDTAADLERDGDAWRRTDQL